MIIALNDKGRRIGESHHRAVISDAMVDWIRHLREERQLTFGQISIMSNVKKGTVVKICRYEIRAQTPERYIRED